MRPRFSRAPPGLEATSKRPAKRLDASGGGDVSASEFFFTPTPCAKYELERALVTLYD
jgi:hypothetical protein